MNADKTYVVPRTCTVVNAGEAQREGEGITRPLTAYADASAYVLIAEPGAGKTTAFETEATRQGGKYVTVRDFRTFDKPEWRNTTLFLDGLDEARAGTEDGRTPLDDVRRKLHELECPAFRLSCRWADWMAATDRDRLREVAPDGSVTVMRLDPLSKRDIEDILANKFGVEDTDSFIAAARQRNVDKLLTNPQNLDLLAKSVLEGKWPDSQRETFEQACRMLAREPNGDHLAANPSAGDIDPLIGAAGRLCAAQLLSGGAGYTLPDRAEPDGDFPSIMEVDSEARGRARQALGTRLFEGISEGKLAPAHRQIAEFLAARHVSGLINNGLPLGRILALITGFDGELVPSFMNFASWLAVHNKRSRRELSWLDASGLIYAGDRDTYSVDEKRDILLKLRRESSWNPWCTRNLFKVHGIGGIVSPELEGTFRGILAEDRRDHEHQSYVMLLMQMLADGEPLPALSDTLEEAVHDQTWNWGVRCATLDVLVAYHARGSCGPEVLVKMLDEIDKWAPDASQDELLGLLLRALFPGVLSIGEVQAYLRAPKLADRTGEYADFWTRHVPKESTPDQLAELLDGIAARFEDYRPFLVGETGRYTCMGELPVKLLTRVLRDMRGGIATERLYDWLGVVSDPRLCVPEGEKLSVRLDLEWNREALKDLIVYGVETCLQRGDECAGLVDRRYFGARPFDYGRWCLEMALGAEDGRAASFYLGELVDCVDDGSRAGGLTVEATRAALAADESLLQQFDEMGSPPLSRVIQSEHAEILESPTDTDDQKAWQARITAEAQALRAGGGPPQLLRQAAEVYLDIGEEAAGKTPWERLGDLIGGRIDLIELLMVGIEGTVTRDDLPSCDHTVRLFDANWIEWPVLPFIAGLHSLEHSGRLAIGDLGESQIRLAVTIVYMLPRQVIDPDSTSGGDVYRPKWFRDLLREDPALVTDVVSRSAAGKLETGVQPAIEIRELAVAEDHRGVAAIASLPVLESFPTAKTDGALTALCWSLYAALRNCDWSEVGRVVGERLERTDQTPGERGCWLTVGYLLEPERYREKFRAMANDEQCLKWLARFVAAAHFPRDFTRRFAAHDFEPFVVALGAALRRVGLSERAFWSTSQMIETLGDEPSVAATEALDALSRAPDAKPWSPTMAEARESQARKRREREYRYGAIGQVVRTLNNGSPANAGDLAALVFDELTHLSLKIRDGSTSDWRQHWNVDHHNRPTDPKPEDACRDALLSDLQERLGRLGIDAQPEGVYAEDNRSDIRVSFGGFNVPVEIKRSCHRDLWTAVRSQLIAKYTRDPGAAGYGIYLVFWFGDTEKCRPTKCSGWTPETAEDISVRIEQLLDDREARLISVCVADVSMPP
ncbi:MAG: hypothetical protein OXE53_00055 [Deltaproteobacteria bacterium]|nr:hypothetical protein [Deltaproteobacteria bacterium]